MDIDILLEEIVDKYRLSEVYPHMEEAKRAENKLCEYAAEWDKSESFLFIATNVHDIDYFKYVFRDFPRAAYCLLPKIRDARQYVDNVEENMDFFRLESMPVAEYDHIYVISLNGSAFVEAYLRQRGIAHTNIYDAWAADGIYLSHPLRQNLLDSDMNAYWDVVATCAGNDLAAEAREVRARMEPAESEGIRKLLLKRLYYLAIKLRDFPLAASCAADMETWRQGAFEKELRAYNEIQELLRRVEVLLKKRTQKDVLLFWNDAMRFEDIDLISYLSEKKDKTLFFDNFYTIVANTHPTFKSMFLGKHPMLEDTYSIPQATRENSPLLQRMEERGYTFINIGGDHAKALPYEYHSDIYYDRYSASSLYFWDMWRQLLLHPEEKLFLLVHVLSELHAPPLMSPHLADGDLKTFHLKFIHGARGVDTLYRFYLPKLSDTGLKCYFSDHGGAASQGDHARHHVFMMFEGAPLEVRKVGALTSFMDYAAILISIIDEGRVEESRIDHESLVIGQVGLYSRKLIYQFFKDRPRRLSSFSDYIWYWGILTKQYTYISYEVGEEMLFYTQQPILPKNLIHVADRIPEHNTVKNELEPLLPVHVPESLKRKLRYTPLFYAVIESAMERNRKRYEVLNAWLQKRNISALAIRTGGMDAFHAYDFIAKEVRQKIIGFVDPASDCLCSTLGMPVYASIDDLPENTHVLLASYDLREMLRHEAQAHPEYAVLDPYAYLETQGIHLQAGFGGFHLEAEDFDVDIAELEEDIRLGKQ